MNICLIGSTRFIEKYTEVNQKLTLGGHVVYSVCMASTGKPEERKEITEDQKETLDLVHLQKILRSDLCVLITDATGYYGASTKREIKWCLMLGKEIMLPEHIRGLQMEKIGEMIEDAVAEVSGIDLKTKLDRSKFRQ